MKLTLRSKARYDVDTGEYRIQHVEDVAPHLEQARQERDREWGQRKDAEIMRYASVPLTVVMEIKENHGIDLFCANRDQMKRVRRIIESEYPHLKTTNRRISR